MPSVVAEDWVLPLPQAQHEDRCAHNTEIIHGKTTEDSIQSGYRHNTQRGRAQSSESKGVLRFAIALLILLVTIAARPTRAMKLVIQRVKSASVAVEGKIVSSIGPGLMALVGLHGDDREEDLQFCCKRLLAAKLFENDNGVAWRHGVKQRGLEVLCVSQFTLYGTLTKKNQPDYKLSMKSVPAEEMYNRFLQMLRSNYEEGKVLDGRFGAMMDVSLVNDGPVTIVVESDPKPMPSGQGAEAGGDELK